MKEWTCSLLSCLMLFVSAFAQSGLQNSGRALFSLWLGIEGRPEQAVVLALADEPPSSPAPAEELSASAAPPVSAATTASAESPTETATPAPALPVVLIYHTHTDEAYYKGEQNYKESSTGRTLDQVYSVVAVGAVLKQELEACGFTVYHDTTDNVTGDFYGAYDKSLKTVTPYVGKAEVFIDLHRDAYEGQQPNYALSGEGQKCAFVRFVVANGENFSAKPRWETNLPLAQALTGILNEAVPGMAKKPLLKAKRYNQHLSDACLLLEVGNQENTLDEAKASARVAAEALYTYYAKKA